MPDYQTIRGISTFEYEEKRSRFIASAAFAKPPVPPCWKPSAMRGFRM